MYIKTGQTGLTSEFENLIGCSPGHSTFLCTRHSFPHKPVYVLVLAVPKSIQAHIGSSLEYRPFGGLIPDQRTENSNIITRKRGYFVQNVALKSRSLPPGKVWGEFSDVVCVRVDFVNNAKYVGSTTDSTPCVEWASDGRSCLAFTRSRKEASEEQFVWRPPRGLSRGLACGGGSENFVYTPRQQQM